MKLLLAALNAKYIHSSLAVYSLRAYCSRAFRRAGHQLPEIEIAEYTINQPVQKMLADIYIRAPQVLFFSCYLWNRREVEQLISDLRKVMPRLEIWLGGPEVSFDAAEILGAFENVRGVIRGEGEDAFYQLAKFYAAGGFWHHGQENPYEVLRSIKGITFRDGESGLTAVPDGAPLGMDSVPFPYEALEPFANRIIYYESSRGCPFRCSYCLSSIERSLRFKSLEKVKGELDFFLERRAPQVKFIDRTFNCRQDHALQVWRYLKENDNGVTSFHFEIAGDLLTDDAVKLLGGMRPGQIQLEIGVQSTNEKTLQEISRTMDLEGLRESVAAIKQKNNIHVHLDLIAGLPYEDMVSFQRSFNDVFAMKPHQLQLGFLKVLKGSPMEMKCEEYGLHYTQLPPYEVLETEWISYGELLLLKQVEEMVELYYNSGQFVRCLKLLLTAFDSPFQLFEALAAWHREHGFELLKLSRNQKYENLIRFGKNYIDEPIFIEAAIYDYYARDNVKSRPSFFGEERVEKTFAKAFYSMEARVHRYLDGEPYEGISDPRMLRRLTHLEKLEDRYYLFDYSMRDPVSGNVRITELAAELPAEIQEK